MDSLSAAVALALTTPLSWLLAGAILVSSKGPRALLGLVAFGAGNALALVGADLGLRLGTPAFAGVWIACACVVVFGARARGREASGFFSVFLMVGVLSGLALASSPSFEDSSQPLAWLFGQTLGIQLAVGATALVLGAAGVALSHVAPGSRSRASGAGEPLPRPASGWSLLGLALAGILAVGLGALAFQTSLRPRPLQPASIFSTAAEAAAVQRQSTRAPLFQSLEEPAVAFLTLQPYQLRVEVLVRAKDLGSWLKGEFPLGKTIDPSAQEPLLEKLSRRIGSGFSLTLDGQEPSPASVKREFVSIDPAGILSRPTPTVETVADARIGLKWLYDLASYPRELSFRWQLFSGVVQKLSLSATTPRGDSQTVLTPDSAAFHLHQDPALLHLPSVQRVQVRPRTWPLASTLFLLLGGAMFLGRKFLLHKGSRRVVLNWTIVLSLALAYGLYPFARVEAEVLPARMDARQAEGILQSLLGNLYHSFDLREESAVYDRLAMSVEGDQLEDIYLANRKALELQKRGGAQAHVDAVRILKIKSVRRLKEGHFALDALWTISGSVTHFGHTHYRRNRNHAVVEIAPVKGAWKILKITVLNEERVV